MSATAAEVPDGISIRKARKAAISGFLGSSLEYYDFLIYGTASALFFEEIFFPSAGAAGTLLSLSTFGVAYLARPFGAVLWGHVGDRMGRRTALVLTIALMGTATFVIGCIPSYSSIGVMAPMLLVLLRLIQGVSAGGESAGSCSLTIEHAPHRRRAFFGSFTMSGIQFGIVVASVVFLPLLALPHEDLISWGWRIPFLVSFLVTVAAYLLRRTLDEPQVFTEVREDNARARWPLNDLVRGHWLATVRVALCGMYYVIGTIVTVFALSYATNVAGLSNSMMLTVIAIANLISILTIPAFGALADRIGRKPVFVIGMLGSVAMVFAFFGAIDTHSVPLLYLATIVLIGVFYAMPLSVAPAYFPEQFPARVRYTGTAVGAMIGFIITGFAPALAEALGAGDATNWTPAAWLCVAFGLLAVVAALTGREAYRTPTEDLDVGRQPRDPAHTAPESGTDLPGPGSGVSRPA